MAGVGGEIKRLREELNMSQPQVAVKAGVAVSAVSQIETGRRSPNVGTLEKIAEALGVEVVDLFPKAQAPLFTPKQVAEPRRPETIIDDLREWIQTAVHVQEFARADRMVLEDTEELPRGWQRGPYGARMVHDNVRRLSKEAEDAFKDMPRELSEAAAEAEAARRAVWAEIERLYIVAEKVAEKTASRADVRSTFELIPGGRAGGRRTA